MVGWRLSLVTTVLGGDVEGAALVDGAFVVGVGVELGATVEDGGELDAAVVFGGCESVVGPAAPSPEHPLANTPAVSTIAINRSLTTEPSPPRRSRARGPARTEWSAVLT